jgi:hypothetical protein
MRRCRQCQGDVANEHRFCPWCGAVQRLKLVELFRPHAAMSGDRHKMLRVSRYVGATAEERHARFSVWNEEGVAEAAVSLDDEETRRLAAFLAAPFEPASRLGTLLSQLRADVEAAFTFRR